MSEHHATLSPSSLPMLDKCQCFEREEGNDKYRDHGTKMHTAISNILQGKDSEVVLTLEEGEQVQWAVDYVRAHQTSGFPLEIEKRLTLSDNNFRLITFGTADVVNGPWMVDWKSLEAHNYWYQMACYALMQMQRQGHDYIEVDVGYLKDKWVERHVITRDEARIKLGALFAKIRNPFKQPNPNEFCKWCSKFTTCEAVKTRVNAVMNGREDWSLDNFHSSQISNPFEMGKALAIANLMGDWVEAVEYHAKGMMRNGVTIPGYDLKEKRGSLEIASAKQAFDMMSELSDEEFLSCCTVHVGKLAEVIAGKEGITIKAAKSKIEDQLLGVAERRPSSWQIRKVKSK